MVLFLLYNAVLAVLDVVLLALLSRPVRGRVLLFAHAGGVAVGVALAWALRAFVPDNSDSGPRFLFLGLIACGVFLHTPAFGFAAAWIARARRPRLARAFGASAVLFLLVGVYAFLIEPRWLEVSRHRITTAKLDRAVRIVVLADLQTRHIGNYERRVVRELRTLEPDLVILTGDYLQLPDDDVGSVEVAALRELLREVAAEVPLGVHAVRGNTERPDWPRLFDGLAVETYGVTRSIDVGELRLTGLTLRDSFRRSLEIEPSERFHVVFGHGPDFAMGDVPADLLLAGHTHGGQVRVPWYGPPITLSRVPRTWAAGRTELPGGGTLIVSRGIGLERGYAPPLRFLCRPELVVIDLEPEEPEEPEEPDQAERRRM